MQKLLDAAVVISSLDPLEATENIIAESCRILDCDRATIFTLDKITQELVLSVAEGAKNIRVPIGQVHCKIANIAVLSIYSTSFVGNRWNCRCDGRNHQHCRRLCRSQIQQQARLSQRFICLNQ